jgi:hypothetical protein
MILQRSVLVCVIVSVVAALAFWVHRDWESEHAGSIVVGEAPIVHQVVVSLGVGSLVGLVSAGAFSIWARAKALQARDEYED